MNIHELMTQCDAAGDTECRIMLGTITDRQIHIILFTVLRLLANKVEADPTEQTLSSCAEYHVFCF